MGVLPALLLCLLAASSAAASSVEAFAYNCQKVCSQIQREATSEIEELSKRVDRGELCPGLGAKAESICTQALEKFTADTGDTDDDASNALFEEKLEELERSLDIPLQLVYRRQLNLLREKALQRYREGSKGSETSDYQAMVSADEWFKKEAEASTRGGSQWDYSAERMGLQGTMNEFAKRSKKAQDAQVKAAQQQGAAMQYLQVQQQQLQAMQQQLYGGGSASNWNFGCAYRIPDSNINLMGTYQQGRANLQVSCVPDDYGAMLGSQGFVHGVGPGNLGLSLNLNV